MAQHVFSGSGAPATTPTAIGQHYVDTLNKVAYTSVGTSSASDWETSDAAASMAAHLAASDPHPQYLTPAEADLLYDALGSAAAKVADAISDGVTTVAPSQNAVFDALSGKANSSHVHPLTDLTQSGATTGQVPKWNGSAWAPADEAGGGGTWGSITGTLSDQTDLQTILDGKQNVINGPNDYFIFKNSSGVVEGFGYLFANQYNGICQSLTDQFENNESHTINANYFALDSQEDSPDTNVIIHNNEVEIDNALAGFSFGDNGSASTIWNNFFRVEGTGDVGGLAFYNNNFSIGNGTDPVSVNGISYMYGFGEVKSGATMNGPMQGYGFQMNVLAGATMDQSNSYANAFYDSVNYAGECSFHTSFNSSPSIDTIPSSKNLTGFSFNPNVESISGSVNGFSVSGNYGTFLSNSNFNGVNVNPNIDDSRYAAGLNVSMDNVTPYAGVQSSIVFQDLTLTFNQAGDNNSYTLEYIDGATAGSESVALLGNNVQITIEDGVSTATQIKSAIDGTTGINAAITVTISGVGSNPQTVAGPTNFTGGENPGRVMAAYLDGDVEITGSLSFGGALSIGRLNAFASQAMINGGGTPNSVHSLISNPTVADNTTISLADTIGVNTAMLLTIGSNSTVTSAFLGAAALALPAVVNIGAGSSMDQVSGGTFAVSLDTGAGAGGVLDNLDLCRSLALPNGVTTVNTMSGYKFDLPFGNPATDAWGFYESPGVNNYFAGNLLVGGTAGSDDKVTNSNCAIQIKSTTKALVLSEMTTTQRDAMTAVSGMVIFNTTTSAMEYYNGSAWI